MFDRLKSNVNNLLQRLSQRELSDKEIQLILREFQLHLVESDIAYSIAEKICSVMRDKLSNLEIQRFTDPSNAARDILKETLLDLLKGSGERSFFDLLSAQKAAQKPSVILFVGVNGTGKTSSIAKLGYNLTQRGFSVVIAAADTYRTGSIEQIEEHARRIGVKVIKHRYGADAAAVAFDSVNYAKAHGINVVLIDTAGRMQTNLNLLEEMKKIGRVTKPDLTVLVVDALIGNDAVEQAKSFSEAVNIGGVILTKLDADTKGGSAISITTTVRKPILFASTGQDYSDLISFEPEQIITKIMP